MFQYANRAGYSDVDAYEVVRRVSPITLEVREMKATLLNGLDSGRPDALKFSPGGFCGHTSGHQRYAFSSDTSKPIVRIRLTKRGWRNKHGRFTLSDRPHKFYDYNF